MFAPFRRGRGAFVGVALAALFAACSGSSSATPSAATQPPAAAAPTVGSTDAPASSKGDTDAACTIITSDAVAQTVGFTIATTSGAGGTCYFQNSKPGKYLVVQLYGSAAAKGDHAIELLEPAFSFGAGGSASRDAMVTLARTALPKL